MLSTETYNPTIVSLQLLPGNNIPEVTDNIILQSLILYIPESKPPVKIETALASIEIFAIKFKYLTRICHTKVMKVRYAGSNPIYKVVLFRMLSTFSSICWLEHLSHGWVNLLGSDIEEALKGSITDAIEYQEGLV